MPHTPYRTAAATAAVVLAAFSLLHLVWLRSPWPLSTQEEFLETVVGQSSPAQSPPPWMTLAVACLLAAAAWLLLARAGYVRGFLPHRLLNAATATAAAVLLTRGVAGLLLSGVIGQGPSAYRFWDLALYSPVTLALGTVAALLARTPAAPGRREPGTGT
ncbi:MULTISPECIES: DUF3995 domain-containing protein [unclassified Streptomyces]|uniref:DUF3995 domain-containing protein n=1 Tax=unclassified Streptomyces TaxID=2593676 RepID=UPI0008DDE2FA|nr:MULTISPECIES: DUF3995 domain-containing protein [unclassified Streptomyces]OII67475.1 hypothetical protein BJP39_01095 [Streptomyces sp. CC77]